MAVGVGGKKIGEGVGWPKARQSRGWAGRYTCVSVGRTRSKPARALPGGLPTAPVRPTRHAVPIERPPPFRPQHHMAPLHYHSLTSSASPTVNASRLPLLGHRLLRPRPLPSATGVAARRRSSSASAFLAWRRTVRTAPTAGGGWPLPPSVGCCCDSRRAGGWRGAVVVAAAARAVVRQPTAAPPLERRPPPYMLCCCCRGGGGGGVMGVKFRVQEGANRLAALSRRAYPLLLAGLTHPPEGRGAGQYPTSNEPSSRQEGIIEPNPNDRL